MGKVEADDVKRWAKAIVTEVEPEDVFVVDEIFDIAPEDWHRADSQDEGRFDGGAAASTFATVVVPFLLGFFGDVVKDVVKDAAKEAIAPLLDRFLKRKATGDEATRLKEAFDREIAKSRFNAEEKNTLREGFETLFAKVRPATEDLGDK
ncbi:hypothetical protein [Methylobacterium sp. B1]|uniref:hypothetical protein n=1 Tax=Methylobacterium sp. B1 TaxID=91459 RepID=UPI00034510B2|nr:hypothetical protein [Methylobacterium sp. B1]